MSTSFVHILFHKHPAFIDLNFQSGQMIGSKERLTATALYICLSFLVLVSPSAVFVLVKRINNWTFGMPEYARVYDTLVFFIRQFNYSMNFFIYLASNLQFRKATRRLFGRDSNVQPITTASNSTAP